MKTRYAFAALLLISTASCGRINLTGLKPPPPGNYDLVAESVTYRPKKVTVGTPVVFEEVVRNVGTDKIPAGTYYSDLFLDGTNISFDHDTRDLMSGDKTSYSMAPGYHDFKPEKPGVYHYRFVLDKENNLPETDEGNNVIEESIVIE